MTIDSTLFEVSYAKVARAQQFINELRKEESAYRDSKPYTCEPLIDASGLSVTVTWRGVGLTPGCLIGDAIHNLRASLDLMASELARLNGKSDSDVYFPFASDKDELEKSIQKRFRKAGEDAIALLKEFAPYRGGNESLRAIHDLDIRDKHTALIVSGTTHSMHVQFRYHLTDPLSGQFEADCSRIVFVFPDDTPLSGRPVVEALEELVELVLGILKAFSSLVEARGIRV
jgi:hypothetical protein